MGRRSHPAVHHAQAGEPKGPVSVARTSVSETRLPPHRLRRGGTGRARGLRRVREKVGDALPCSREVAARSRARAPDLLCLPRRRGSRSGQRTRSKTSTGTFVVERRRTRRSALRPLRSPCSTASWRSDRFSCEKSMATSGGQPSSRTSGRRSRKDVEWSTDSSWLRHQPISTRLGTDPRSSALTASCVGHCGHRIHLSEDNRSSPRALRSARLRPSKL